MSYTLVHTLERYGSQKSPDSHQGRSSDLQPEKVRHDNSADGSDPQILDDEQPHLEAVHVIGHQISHLSHSSGLEGCVAQT